MQCAVPLETFVATFERETAGERFGSPITCSSRGRAARRQTLGMRPTTCSSTRWILEAILSLMYLGARHERVLLGLGVIVPGMRDSPALAKELSTLDDATLLCEQRDLPGRTHA